MKLLKILYSKLFFTLPWIRRKLYDIGLLKSLHLPIPVISVGNLTFGGTGKTPFVAECVKWCIKNNKRPAIICRSYRASLKKAEKVMADEPSKYGDEAVWYAKKFPQISVWSGPLKSQTAETCFRSEPVDCLIIDDGFQHLALQRQLDFVVLDLSAPRSEYYFFPFGRSREALAALKYADVIVMNKANLTTVEEQEKNKIFFSSYISEQKILYCQPSIKTSYQGDGPFVLVAGIGKPAQFFKMMQEKWSGKITEQISYADHHQYTREDVEHILNAARKTQSKAVLTTEKDYVKLQTLWTADLPLVAIELDLEISGSLNLFDEALQSCFR